MVHNCNVRDEAVLLYDGVCGLCNRVVRFVLKRDALGRFRFVTLQGEYAHEVLTRHGRDPRKLETVYLVEGRDTDGERLLAGPRAVLHALKLIGGGWRALACAVGWLPTPLLGLAYRLVARTRYRVFGKHDACPMPDPKDAWRFLE